MLAASIAQFHGLPLRRRMSVLIGVCAAITTLLCLLAVVGSGLWLQQNSAREETDEVARTLSFALQAPVAFEDRAGVQDVLNLLRARPQVEAAFVYDRQGNLLASYGLTQAAASRLTNDGLLAGRLQGVEDIRSESGSIGRVVVINRLSRLWQAMGLAMLAIVLSSLAGMVLSVVLAQRIARTITKPIDILADASREIARSHDYAQRLPQGGSDEIGTATRAFNEMLEEISARGDALVAANLELERRVSERTQSLQSERDRAEAASLAKTRFLANMSHELRTPLNAVIGAAQLLQNGQQDDGTRGELVGAIRISGAKLLDQIENVLDLARIESGSLDLVNQDFSVLECLESAVATVSVAARIKGLHMACAVAPTLAVWRRGDSTRLRQILINLLGNAVKFTQKGEVVLRVSEGPESGSICMTATDTGIGIGQASLAQVFEPFRQADDASNRRFGGSGLGLAIAKQLIEAMGGAISVQSELGVGSCFQIVLKLPPAQAIPRESAPLKHTVVFFEPHDPTAEGLGALLARLGCSGHRFSRVAELHAWIAHADTDCTKAWCLVALCDQSTPEWLGLAGKHFKSENIIGMDSGTQVSREVRQQLGASRSLVKPVSRAALVSSLGPAHTRSLLARAPVAPTSGLMQANSSPKRVLVVEDDSTNQMIVCSMLQSAGYETSTASTGAQALQMLSQHAHDVVLMDWQMPDMDGLEATRQLRAGVAGRFGAVVPIIGLTANAFTEDRLACLAAGMNDYLTKPVLMASLLATVERWTARPGGDEVSVQASAFAPLL